MLNRISAGGRVSHALIPYANKHTYPLSDRRHEADTVLVDLDLTRQPLAVQRRSHEYLGKLRRSTAFDLHKGILFDDVSHLLLLLFALIDFLLQICNLLCQSVEAVIVDGAVGY